MNRLQQSSDKLIFWLVGALLACGIHIYVLWWLSAASIPAIPTSYPTAIMMELSAEPEFMQNLPQNSVVGITQNIIEPAVERRVNQPDDIVDLPTLPEQPQGQREITRKEPIKVKRPPENRATSRKPVNKETQETQESDSKQSSPAAAASAMLSGTSQRVAAAVNSDSSHRQQAQVSWKSRLQGHLMGFKRYPSSARKQQQQGTAMVRFVVDKNGYVSSVQLSNSSGTSALDREALAIIKRAQPLPKPPAELLSQGQITLSLPVDFNLKRK
ncbi:energy transducer TonB [Yersinia similis]|uniref:energy transducer TonB family protein n=1 Tax=Yersinia similis TaxID=367190 RepID=UPI00061C2461|nr:energy transducer TonB [Yersinia similis]CNB74341.1 TonB domain-containing protein [Yersinia similis]